MNRFGVLLLCAFGASSLVAADVTFYKDVLPVLQKNCQACHRPGEAAPMTFMSYQDTRPWAKAIKQAVLSQKMPPWFADPSVGKFHNARILTPADKSVLIEWANTGAAPGDSNQAPAPMTWAEGWSVGTPDVIYQLPEAYSVPASGTVEYTYFIVPTGFTEDKWVTAAEARPGTRAQVHHIIAFVREPGSKWMREYPVGKAFVPKKSNGESGGGAFLTGYAPGAMPEKLEPGQAKLIKAGSDIVFQMHYTANGKPASDVSRVGIVFAKEAPTQRVVTLAAQDRKFVIPAGASNHRVDGAMTLHADSDLMALFPHMHVRGKAFEMRAVYPSGESEVLLKVPAYDFNWQLSYRLEQPKKLPKGTRIEATGWFDNSPNNKSNPDPTKEVRWGDQSWEEMMIGFFNVAIDAKANPADLFKAPKPVAPTATSGGE
ncbi:MAG: thiol-disulfide isomerase [Bryobacterales bacterium]|nr:thiol-disulfide isomerase [Bryobacterales bacterium]